MFQLSPGGDGAPRPGTPLARKLLDLPIWPAIPRVRSARVSGWLATMSLAPSVPGVPQPVSLFDSQQGVAPCLSLCGVGGSVALVGCAATPAIGTASALTA